MIPVYLECGSKRDFACSVEWPGWSRSGRDEAGALETLASTGERFAAIAEEAGLSFPLPVTAAGLEVVERLPGSATTDFGAPAAIRPSDDEPMPAAERERTLALLQAAWTVLERVVATAPAELRKGPRGGGRDRDDIAAHVVGAEVEYHRKLGFPRAKVTLADVAGVAAMRAEILSAIEEAGAGGRASPKSCPPRYAARRLIWHVVDHIWEIEDKSE